MTLLLAFAIWLPKLALGFLAAHKLWDEKTPSALALKAFLSVPLGMGISSLLFFAWLGLGLPHSAYPPLEALAAAILIWRAGNPLQGRQPAGFLVKPSDLAYIFPFLALGGLALFFFFRSAFYFPHGYEDAWFIWNMAARFLYRAADWTLRFTAQSGLWHPDYPLLLPLNITQGWLWLGETTRIPIAAAALFTFCLPGLVFSALYFSGQKVHALSAAGLLLLTPWFIEYGAQQMADIPLAGFLLGAAIALWLFEQTESPRLMVLSGALAGFAAWTKNEGWLFWAVCFLTVLTLPQRRSAFSRFLLGSLPPLTAALAFKVFLAPANDLFAQNTHWLQQIFNPARFLQIFSAFAQQIGAFGGWRLGIFWALLVYSFLIGFERRALRHSARLWALIFLQLAGYFAIYLITPHDLDWHLRTSLTRLLMQVFPLTLFALFASLRPVRA